MKARDVLAEIDDGDLYAGFLHETDQAVIVDALLATTPEGEGVYIAPDGELWRIIFDTPTSPTRLRPVPLSPTPHVAEGEQS